VLGQIATIACAGTPGSTAGAYGQQCQTAAGARYSCNNSAGCAVAADWVLDGGSGGGTWGSITGTLSNQADLASALSGKQATLTAYTTIAALSGYPSAFAPVNSGNWAGTWQSNSPSAFEPALGNPGSSGYVLSSTTGGVRSWVAQSSGSPTCSVGTYNFGACEVKTVIAYTDATLKVAATSSLKTLFTLPAYAAIVGTYVKHTTQFTQTGGAVSTMTVAITDTGASDYSYPFEVFNQAAASTAFWMDGGMAAKDTAAETISANFVANANLGTGSATYFTAGSVTVTVRYIPLLLP
jgi:hypothetical protein